jgi:hypothetical protein
MIDTLYSRIFMNKQLFIAMLIVMPQTHASPSLTFINDDPADPRCGIQPCVILHNNKLEWVSGGDQVTIPCNAQQSIILLRPITNLIRSDAYYKFTATLTCTESDTHEKTFTVHSYKLFKFDSANKELKYSIPLNEHATLEVEGHPLVRLLNDQIEEIKL